MELGLKGRTAVISGGSKGIGKAIAKGLAAEGVNVALLARGKEALEQAAEEIKRANNAQVLAVPTDVTDMEAVKAAAAATAEKFGAVHIVVNNAAMNHLTKYLARELAGDQITVNAVVPGIVSTEWREVWAENMGRQQGKTKAEFLDEYMRRIGILAGRWASMEEVSDAVVFLASDRARYINGTEIPVDGGYSVNAR